MERTASHTTQVSPLSHISSISVPRGPLESHTQKQNNNKKEKPDQRTLSSLTLMTNVLYMFVH